MGQRSYLLQKICSICISEQSFFATDTPLNMVALGESCGAASFVCTLGHFCPRQQEKSFPWLYFRNVWLLLGT